MTLAAPVYLMPIAIALTFSTAGALASVVSASFPAVASAAFVAVASFLAAASFIATAFDVASFISVASFVAAAMGALTSTFRC